MRPISLALCSLGLTLFLGSAVAIPPARAEVAGQATPAASPAPAEPPPAATVEAPVAGTPAPAAAAPAPAPQTDIITLVAWYATDASGDFIGIVPIAVDAALVAGPAEGTATIGRADFPEEDVPKIQIEGTNFDSYARSEGDIPERWTWFDDAEGARPATLVLQIAGLDGIYQGYFGTATFISRDDGGAGGVLVLALRPPSPAAAEPAAVEEGAAPPAEAAPEGEAVAEEAVQPDADIDPPTETVAEPEA